MHVHTHAQAYTPHVHACADTHNQIDKSKVNSRTREATFTIKNEINSESQEFQVGFRPQRLSAR